MQRNLLGVALILGSVACVSTSRCPQELLLNSRHAARVDNPLGLGTAFPISDTAWLTAMHVVEGWEPNLISVDGFVVKEVIPLGELDAAVLITEPHGQTPWPLADRDARPGERVFKSGYGAGEHWWTEGIATEDSDRVAIDIFHGDSGGPLFSADGEVLGIVVTVGAYGRGGRILHHCGVVPMSEILPLIPDGILNAPDEAQAPPPAPLPVEETPWERFQRIKKERGL